MRSTLRLPAVLIFIALVFAFVLSNATAQSRRGPSRAETGAAPGATDESIKSHATDIVKEIIEGLSEGDYTRYTSHFSDVMRKAQSREAFLELQKNLQKKLGAVRSVEYIGHYRQYGGTVTLFKARYSKEPEDVIIKLVLDRDKSSPMVTGLWLDSPRLAN